jgi:hypothetical protein
MGGRSSEQSRISSPEMLIEGIHPGKTDAVCLQESESLKFSVKESCWKQDCQHECQRVL